MLRVIGGRSRGRKLPAEWPGARSGRRRTGCARPSSTSSAHRAGSRDSPWSICSAAVARSASRRCPGGRPRPPRRPQSGRFGRCPPEPRGGGAPGRAGDDGAAALPGWLDSAAAGSFDLALCDPPYTFEEWPALLGALRADTVVMESASTIVPPGPWVVAESAGTAVRSSPWLIAAVTARESRSFPGVVRPLPQRAPRDRGAGQPALRRGGGCRAAQSPEEHRAVRPGGAPGDVGRGGGSPPVRADRVGVDPAGQRRPGRGRLGDCAGAAGRVGLRGRDADGPDEQPPLRCRDDLHPHQPRVVIRGLQVRPRSGRFGGDVSAFVPKAVAEQLKAKYTHRPAGGDEE